MVVDCFPFLNELDMLELRLHELSPLVDTFVLSEATHTFSNKPKPLVFDEHRDRFRDFANRIEHVVIDRYDGLDRNDPWSMERGQKQIALDIALDRLQPSKGDILIVSDCDEIPRAETLARQRDTDWLALTLEMPLYYYHMNCLCTNRPWRACKVVRYQGERLRHRRIRHSRLKSLVVANAGWHFSYLGDADAIQYKIGASAHVEYDRPPFNTAAHIASRTARGKDLFDRDYQFTILDDLGYLPQYVRENLGTYGKYLREAPA